MPTVIEPQPEPPPPRRRSLIARILRFPLKLVVMVVLGLILGMRRHPRLSTLGILLLILAGGLTYYLVPPMPAAGRPGAATASAGLTSAQGSLPSPQTPMQFFQAQDAGDANGIWNLFSDSLKQASSLQQVQAQLQQVKPRMGTMTHIAYVGGTKEEDGNGVYLYLVTLDQGGQTAQVTYLFTLDPQGKIVKIE